MKFSLTNIIFFLLFSYYSFMWRWICNLFSICRRINSRTIRFVRSTFDWCAGWPHNRFVSIKKFRAKTPRTIVVVDRIGSLCCLHDFRNCVQFDEYGGRPTTRRKRRGDKRTFIPWSWYLSGIKRRQSNICLFFLFCFV